MSTYMGLRDAIRGREERFPLLARSLADMQPAISPKIEWRVEVDGKREAWFNYCEIVRTPFDGDDEEGLEAHLAAIEKIISDGVRVDAKTESGKPRRRCGGVRAFLGRDATDTDSIRLRALRDLAFYEGTPDATDEEVNAPVTMSGDGEGGLIFTFPPRRQNEWISEVALQVSPA